MCGICGIHLSDPNRSVEPSVIEAMKDEIVHRGPDDHGSYVDGNIGMGFRRLSIVDLKHGHQPMSNLDGNLHVVFNGEIYNHNDIRPGLISAGINYRTKCDTETIVNLFQQKGTSCFSEFNGMFGIAVWDSRTRELVLARDRLGIKPIYYARIDGGIVFASEIKAILASGMIEAELDETVVEEYLMFRYVAGERTVFKNIKSLLPGTILRCNGDICTEKFWELPDASEKINVSEKNAVDGLEEILDNSVRMRLMSDVPLGTFCSGGVDSSLTTALAAQHADAGLNTFSVGFHEAEFDESVYAETVSKKYNTSHHTIKMDNREFADLLPDLIWQNDEPLNHPNSVQIFKISQLARQHVIVVLTGEGADELFGGYPRYHIGNLVNGFGWVPSGLRKAMGSLMGLMPHRKIRKLGSNLHLDAKSLAVLNSCFTDWNRVSDLLESETTLPDIVERRLALAGKTSPDTDFMDLLFRLELRTYLVSILSRQDKMSMAASIESRVPFLDHRIVEWGLKIPLELKLKGTENKHIVKTLGLQWLPKETIYRQKSGFGVPIGDWLKDRQGLGRYLDLLESDSFKSRTFFDHQAVRSMVDGHLKGAADNSELLWTLINLEIWYRKFVSKEAI